MSRLFPNPPRKWQQDKYRLIEWQEEQKKRRKKEEESRLSKEEFIKKWKGEESGTDQQKENT